MKICYYVKILRDPIDSIYVLSFPDFPIAKISCISLDEACIIAKKVIQLYVEKESFVPLPVPYLSEEYYPIYIDN